MLIINNGVPKSGSTWVQKIIRTGLSPAFPDNRWCNKNHAPSIRPKRLADYVASQEWKPQTTLVKMHFTYDDSFSFLDDHDDIKVIVSYRNLPDSVISYFHHESRKDMLGGKSKEEWLADDGRRFAERAVAHRLSWMARPNTHLMRFEEMVAGIGPQIEGLMAFLGVETDAAGAHALGGETQVSLKPGEKPREGNFVRTAGRSVASEELPSDFFAEFSEMEQAAQKAQA